MNLVAAIKDRFTAGVAVVLLHYCTWRLGVWLMHYEQNVEGLGINLMWTAVELRWYVFAGVCLYSLMRRFVMHKREWDVYAPPLAFFSAGVIYLDALKHAN